VLAKKRVPEEAVAAVFARAAELDLQRPSGDAHVHLDDDALVEIGASVGLSEQAVRRAVAEHRAGALVPVSQTAPATWVGPRVAVAERRIDGDPAALRRSVEQQLERQWFRRVRDQGERSVWCARNDVAARVARKVDFRQRLVLRGVVGVIVTAVDCGDDGVVVRLEADPAERRSELGWAVALAAAGGAAVGAVIAAVTEPSILDLASLPGAGFGGGGGLRLARRSYRSQLDRLTDDLAGMLDRLERRAG
jgi:hypothetical protein